MTFAIQNVFFANIQTVSYRTDFSSAGADSLSENMMLADDYAGDTSTRGVVSVGGSITGNIEVAYDTDWFAITLAENETIRISQNGVSLGDPLVRIFTSSGSLLDSNDDGGPGLNSLLTFTAFTAGTYYISAEAYSFDTGTYTLSVASAPSPPPPPPYNPLEALTWGTQLADATNITVYFGTSGYNGGAFIPGIPAVTSEGFNAYEQARFRAAFDLLEAAANVNFTIVNNAAAADFRLTLDTNEIGSSSLGYFDTPTASGAAGGGGVFNGAAWDRTAGGDLEAGGQGFATIVHELMHGLGLSHPHDFGGDSNILPGVSAAFGSLGIHQLNQGVFTGMSYNGGLSTGGVGTGVSTSGNSGFEAGPMALDIAVLQLLYGANTTTGAGTTVYTLPTSNSSGTSWRSIWDTSGTDTIRHTGNAGATIDLREATLLGAVGGGGYLSSVNGIAGGFTIANGARIENAIGGSGSDMLVGNALNNVLTGGTGNDTIMASAGRDQLNGDGGIDTVDYAASRGSLRVDLLFSQINTNIAAGDTYTGIENLSGSQGADNLRGTFGDNVIFGQRNVDYIFGRRGQDTLDGGIGNDVLFGGVDADVLRGGANRDRAQYSEALEAVILDLMNTSRNTGEAAGDVYDSIEDLAGSSFNDDISGDLGANQLFGREGNDRLYGRAGDDYLNGGGNNDRLDGGAGNDTLRGGQSSDTFVFNSGRDVIEDMNVAHLDRIALQASEITQVVGLNGAQILSRFGSVENGNVVLRFDVNTTLVVQNITTLAELENNIFVF